MKRNTNQSEILEYYSMIYVQNVSKFEARKL